MKRIRLFQAIQAKLIIIYVLLILIAMQLIGVYFIKTVENYFKTDYMNSQNDQSVTVASLVDRFLNPDKRNPDDKKNEQELNDFVSKLFAVNNSEIQIIDANGLILSTSLNNHQNLVGQKNTQAEVISALQGIKNNHRMFMDVDGFRKLINATPVTAGSKVIGAVYIVSSMEMLYKTMNQVNRIFIGGTVFALALTAILGVILSHTITSPIKEITEQATAVAEGNFDRRLKVRGQDEIGQLAETFNTMTNRLKEALWINEEEKEKLASVLSNMNDGVIATDSSGRIIVINSSAMQILGTEDECIGQHMTEVLGLSLEDIEELTLGDDNATVLQVNIAGKEHPVSVKAAFTPIHRGGEGITGTIAVLQNVSEQERLEQSRKEFVANVSHELRTPLTTLKSYLEALDDGALEEPQLAQRFVGVARNETERMIRLVTDLLQLSRLDNKQASLSKEPTDITEMLDEVADRFSFQLRQRKIQIRIAVERGLPEVQVDRDQIDQVLDNLISNAIKYTPDAGKINIEAGLQGKDYIAIGIQDNGIGIPKNDLDRIFERFYRVDKARSRNMGGTGLGLSIAREIVKAHGGTIALESELNKGTKVTFTLPVPQGESVSA